MRKLAKLVFLFRAMGLRYLSFRLNYEVQRRLGILRWRFPTGLPLPSNLPALKAWQHRPAFFFFSGKQVITFTNDTTAAHLAGKIDRLRQGELLFFSSMWLPLDPVLPWHRHPVTGYQYPASAHWTNIPDFSPEAGDIKYIWEKARFSWLLDVIRYDASSGTDQSEFVFHAILDFIDKNPLNLGPHYRCSQEMSIRLLNWTFALAYYRHHPSLTEERLHSILQSVHGQLRHVRSNIHFSRIAVRNNHALTETLMLYLAGFLYPDCPKVARWSSEGRQWFIEEVTYQIREDGTFLQHSMNYHRVVIQLLTWALGLSRLHGDPLPSVVEQRARASLDFLRACMAGGHGELPHYGMNDGALFFPLNDQDFRDYRPQLQALEWILDGTVAGPEIFEDVRWLAGGQPIKMSEEGGDRPRALHQFQDGGYILYHEPDTTSFIRCCSYRDRPHQADDLHLDIWVNGANVFRDAGSYLYNTSEEWIRYFNGSEGHNGIMINDEDQMLKGPRFIWYFWPEAIDVQARKTEDGFSFTGELDAFQQMGPDIRWRRSVQYTRSPRCWLVVDEVSGLSAPTIRQLWHPHPDWANRILIEASDDQGNPLDRQDEQGWFAPRYGAREPAPQWSFYGRGHRITTRITLNQ